MNSKLRIFVFVIIGVIISGNLQANKWRSHLSYYQIFAIAQGNQKIFAATGYGLFSYDPADQSFATRSRVEGLSDSGISAIAWSTSKNALIIGYSNGNLDLLSGNTVLNLPDIKIETTFTNKSINNILCEGDFLWLSCDFGIVKIDLKKWEVAETWIIGSGASPIAVNELVISDKYFWAATKSGIFRADKNNLNLQDYSNWIRQDQLPFPQNQFISIAVSNNHIYTCDNEGRIYNFDGITWQPDFTEISGVRKIRALASTLFFIGDKSIISVSATMRLTVSDYGTLLPANTEINPADVLPGNSGEWWIGDRQFGLVRKVGNGSYYSTMPPSPANNNSRRLVTSGSYVYAATGNDGDGNDTIPAEIFRLKDSGWFSINEYSDTKLSGIENITSVIPWSANPEHFWASTSGDGLLEFDGQKIIKNYNSNNSPLETLNGKCKIGGLTFDALGNLWVTNPSVKTQIHILKPDGAWKSLSYPGIDNQFSGAGDILITKAKTTWIIVNHSDLFALRTQSSLDNTTDDIYKKTSVRSMFSNGETTVIKGFNQINVLAEDHDGYLWVGTENGIVLYTSPEILFGDKSFYGVQPSFDLGDGLFHPLLENETVNAIAVDGGNRKWFGTTNSGVFLFSPDGSKMIYHFNTGNSPLFSNNITSIAINGQNGEVFFATDKGLISFMSDATQSNTSFRQLYAYPNPVRETYDGDITIDGLTAESNVKITDVTGNLVFKTTSVGGRALWNGKNRNGERVSTGVYLIFCNDKEGNQSRIIKLLFIH